ncbi:uncharacterized protein N7496_004677 [Penicillium cataractarum]|uniref:F-box domain-containing protein n=1 Tax=Penicillium cataractarum TaxID=2100454 RepID=A0A9W9SER5_9EURO|nr:uncharacterized protein N7496_004677 [Penicillium cataractarum]KAJ5377268.1 hypothetical protein N7496_004677 [Penicillium cataractarum]
MSDTYPQSPLFLPPELLLHVARFLTTARDFNAFVRVSRAHYAILNSTLYYDDAKREKPHALFWAAIHNQKETATKALKAKTDPQITADLSRLRGATPIILAAYHGSSDVLDILLAREDINPNIRDRMYLCPAITWAVKKNQVSALRLLLKDKRVNVNLQDKNGETALMTAVINQPDLIPVMLGCARVNPQVGDRNGRTPLSRAAQQKNPDTPLILAAHLRLILDGFDDREHCQQVFYSAAIFGQCDIMKHMVSFYGAKLNPNGDARGIAGTDHAVFTVAVERNLQEIVQFLLEWDKTDPNQHDTWQHKTPLFRAADRGLEKMVSILKEHDRVDLNLSNIHGMTPLMVAIEEGHLEVVQCLLSGSRCPDVNLTDNTGVTALWHAAIRGEPKMVQRLLEVEGIDACIADSQGVTPKRIATMHNNTEVVKILDNFTI